MKKNIFRQVMYVMFCVSIILQSLQSSVFAADNHIKPTKDSDIVEILDYHNRLVTGTGGGSVDKEKNRTLYYEPAKERFMNSIKSDAERNGIYPTAVNQTYLHENPLGNNSVFEFTKLTGSEFDPIMMGPLSFWTGGTIKYTKAEKEDYSNHYLVLFYWGGGGWSNEIVAYTSKLGDSLTLDKPGIYTLCAYDVSVEKNILAQNNFNYLDGARQVYVYDFPDSVKAPKAGNKSTFNYTDWKGFDSQDGLSWRLTNHTDTEDKNIFAIVAFSPEERLSGGYNNGFIGEIHYFNETLKPKEIKNSIGYVIGTQISGSNFIGNTGLKIMRINFENEEEMASFKSKVPIKPNISDYINYVIRSDDAGIKWMKDNFDITIKKATKQDIEKNRNETEDWFKEVYKNENWNLSDAEIEEELRELRLIWEEYDAQNK